MRATVDREREKELELESKEREKAKNFPHIHFNAGAELLHFYHINE